MKVNIKVLFLATVDLHVYYFHIPFMKLLRDMGYEVVAANVGFKDKIEQEGFKVYNIPFSRNPISVSNFRTVVVKFFSKAMDIGCSIYKVYVSICTNIEAIFLLLIRRLIN